MKGINRKPAIQKQKTNLRIPHVYIYLSHVVCLSHIICKFKKLHKYTLLINHPQAYIRVENETINMEQQRKLKKLSRY